MSTSLSTLSWLPEDLTGTATTNFVQNEVHTSDVTGSLSRFVIIPAQGAFYDTDNLKVVYHTNTSDTVLQRDNDYRLVGIDFGRTKVSSAQGGVYHFIMITTVFVYDSSSYITIDYQAFGGYMSYRAYGLLVEAVSKLEGSIASDGIITADNIADNLTIKTLTRELQALCTKLQYAPSIAHVLPRTSGGAANWSTIAVSRASYDSVIDFTDPETLTGTFGLTIHSELLTMKAMLSYDLTPPQSGVSYPYEGKLKADIVYQNLIEYDPKTTLNDEGYFQDHRMIIPVFKLVVDRSAGAAHKVYLQMEALSTGTGACSLMLTDSTDQQITDISSQYTLTSDTVFSSGKTYYTRSGANDYYLFSKATVTVGNPVPANTYYELTNIGSVSTSTIIGNFELVYRPDVSSSVPTPPANSPETNKVIALKDFYKIWDGNISANLVQSMSYGPRTISEEYNVADNLIPSKDNGYEARGYIPTARIPVEDISAFMCDIYDRFEKEMIHVVIPASKGNALNKFTSGEPIARGIATFFGQDNCTIELILSESNAQVHTIKVYVTQGRNSVDNERFDLRAIYFK